MIVFPSSFFGSSLSSFACPFEGLFSGDSLLTANKLTFLADVLGEGFGLDFFDVSGEILRDLRSGWLVSFLKTLQIVIHSLDAYSSTHSSLFTAGDSFVSATASSSLEDEILRFFFLTSLIGDDSGLRFLDNRETHLLNGLL